MGTLTVFPKENLKGRGGEGGGNIVEFRGHGGITQFGNSEGKGGGEVKYGSRLLQLL